MRHTNSTRGGYGRKAHTTPLGDEPGISPDETGWGGTFALPLLHGAGALALDDVQAAGRKPSGMKDEPGRRNSDGGLRPPDFLLADRVWQNEASEQAFAVQTGG